MEKKIFFIGMRGSGKTTVGSLLAERLGLPFLDLDDELCKREKQSIAEIVEKRGWDAFRKKEEEILKICLEDASPAIVATGGGVVLSARNRQLLFENGVALWLKAEPAILAERLTRNPLLAQRPAFTDKSLLEELEMTHAERHDLYKSCAHHILDGARSAHDICNEVCEIIKNKNF